MTNADTFPSFRHRTVRGADDVTLDVRVAEGDPGAPVVLFAHGWMVSGAVWDAFFDVWRKSPPLSRRPTFVVPDQRGTGRSGTPTSPDAYGLADYGRDLLAIADTLPAKRFAIVGHSMGGQIAQWTASEAPERVSGMALLSPVPLGGLTFPDDARTLFATSAGDRAKQGMILDSACKLLTPEARNRMLDDAAHTDAACIRTSFETFLRGADAARLDAVRAKSLVVATDDPFLPVEFLENSIVRAIRDAEILVVDGAGHYPQVESPSATVDVVRRFVASLPE
ncbi:MAG: alpha/beta hydrolase [Polyangiaceae bacterium]